MRLGGDGYADPTDETDTTTGNGFETGGNYHTYSVLRKFKWVCHGDKPCKRCARLHGKVYTMDEWNLIGIEPGWHKHCQCAFVEVDEKISSDHEIDMQINWGRPGDDVVNLLNPPEDDTWHFLDD